MTCHRLGAWKQMFQISDIGPLGREAKVHLGPSFFRFRNFFVVGVSSRGFGHGQGYRETESRWRTPRKKLNWTIGFRWNRKTGF